MTMLEPPSHANATAAAAAAQTRRAMRWRSRYLCALTWAFMLLTAARLAAYLPTLMAIWHTRDSQQHSLWTWLTWVGANLTMAAWIYENNQHQMDKAIGVSLANALACALTAGTIAWYRL